MIVFSNSLRIVVVNRGHVGKRLASIKAYPIEAGVGEGIDKVPCQLVGIEVLGTGKTSDLRELG